MGDSRIRCLGASTACSLWVLTAISVRSAASVSGGLGLRRGTALCRLRDSWLVVGSMVVWPAGMARAISVRVVGSMAVWSTAQGLRASWETLPPVLDLTSMPAWSSLLCLVALGASLVSVQAVTCGVEPVKVPVLDVVVGLSLVLLLGFEVVSGMVGFAL